MTLRRLVLFDIDGTLLDCGGQPRPLLVRAFEEVYGTAGAATTLDFAGKTDDQIVYESLTAAGRSENDVEEGLSRVKERYLDLLERRLDGRRMRLFDGVESLLEELDGRREVAVGLLTGNWEGGARIKLSRVGLDRFFSFGAFGDGCRRRNDLPPVGLARARVETGRSFEAAETLLVGDTPRDVACGRAHGISVLAVATGGHDRDELSRAGARWVVDDLTEAAPLLDGADPV